MSALGAQIHPRQKLDKMMLWIGSDEEGFQFGVDRKGYQLRSGNLGEGKGRRSLWGGKVCEGEEIKLLPHSKMLFSQNSQCSIYMYVHITYSHSNRNLISLLLSYCTPPPKLNFVYLVHKP